MNAMPRLFYGWYMVGIALVSGAFQTGVGIWGVSVFVIPMEEDLGWSRAAFFLALTIRTATTGLLSPVVGPWLDTKNGPRRLMLFGSIVLGCSLMGLRWVESIWAFYLLFGVLGAVGAVGAGGIITQTILPKWFIRRRGRAMGVASMGGAMGPLFFPHHHLRPHLAGRLARRVVRAGRHIAGAPAAALVPAADEARGHRRAPGRRPR